MGISWRWHYGTTMLQCLTKNWVIRCMLTLSQMWQFLPPLRWNSTKVTDYTISFNIQLTLAITTPYVIYFCRGGLCFVFKVHNNLYQHRHPWSCWSNFVLQVRHLTNVYIVVLILCYLFSNYVLLLHDCRGKNNVVKTAKNLSFAIVDMKTISELLSMAVSGDDQVNTWLNIL